jgi:hypothetical protein
MPGIAIKAQNLSKSHQIYNQQHDRLRQSIYPHYLQSLIGKPPKKYFPEF